MVASHDDLIALADRCERGMRTREMHVAVAKAVGRRVSTDRPPWWGIEGQGLNDAFVADLSTLDGVRTLIYRMLPEWWVCSGICELSGHASLGPDYNGHARERLLKEFPVEHFSDGFHVDLKPGDHRFRECLALLSCLLRALAQIQKLKAD